MIIKNSNFYHYDQKKVLSNFVLNYIQEANIKSLLDIGAGFTETALVYQNAVNHYQAIEQDFERSAKLIHAGVNTLVRKFPNPLETRYDMVLSSHSIPEDTSEYQAYIEKAWELLNKKGSLVIITFKGAKTTLAHLSIELLGEKGFPYPDQLYLEMMRILQYLGEPKTSNIISTERSQDPDDIIRTLCFSLQIHFDKWRPKLLSVLETRFKDEKGYFFPHEHEVIILNSP